MNDDQTQNGQSNETQVTEADERKILMDRARLMGIQFSNNISTDKLRERIADKQEGRQSKDDEEQTAQVNPLENAATKGRPLRKVIQEENMKLVRLRIQNLNPQKKDLPGEIITVANEYLGTVRKFVPFGEATENGYHVPYCIYKQMKNRRFLNLRTRKGRNNQIEVEQLWAKEFALEVLDPLTPEEIKKLANAQTASGSVS